MNKRVLHICLKNPFYINGISKGFENNGWKVTEFNYSNVIRMEGLYGAWQRMIYLAQQQMPDLIFIHCNKDGFLFPNEVKELTKIAFTVLYTFDVRNENNWIEDVAPHLDLVCFSDRENVKAFKEKGFSAEYLQVSCDMDFYKPITPTKDYGDIIFIGNNYINTTEDFELKEQRKELVDFMQKTFGNRFRVYGRNFGNLFLNPEQEREAYSSCKIAITHNHFKREGYCSDRDFRAMSCGALTVCQDYEGIDNVFYKWKTFSQLKRFCSSVLINDRIRETKANEISNYVRENHNWRMRIRQLLHYVNNYQHNKISSL